MKTNYCNSTLQIICIALLIWITVSKDSDMKNSLAELKNIKSAMERTTEQLNNALAINHAVIAKAQKFQKLVHEADSLMAAREKEAIHREMLLKERLERITHSIELLKEQLITSEAHLPKLATGTMK